MIILIVITIILIIIMIIIDRLTSHKIKRNAEGVVGSIIQLTTFSVNVQN